MYSRYFGESSPPAYLGIMRRKSQCVNFLALLQQLICEKTALTARVDGSNAVMVLAGIASTWVVDRAWMLLEDNPPAINQTG